MSKRELWFMDTEEGVRLSVGEDHQLRVNGDLVVTRQAVRLERGVSFAVIVTAFATVVIAVASVVSLFR